MEETAYMLHLTLKVHVPVEMEGSQRPLSALSSDGPMNLCSMHCGWRATPNPGPWGYSHAWTTRSMRHAKSRRRRPRA
ncbi:asparaginase domain-containing protein [Caballeronia sp.]|uniref:asparaginase domain-containing protein n=1 Tax=Caballeronia sp. TaxID=1931223 RepID=UPI003429A304